jgi:hypothetical protein
VVDGAFFRKLDESLVARNATSGLSRNSLLQLQMSVHLTHIAEH